MLTKMRVQFGCLCLAIAGLQAQPANAQMFPALQRSPVVQSGPVVTQPVVYMTQAPATPQAPSTPQAPGRPTPDQLAQQPNAGFGEAAPAGTEGSGSYAPQMLGDSLSYHSFGQFLSNGEPLTGATGSSNRLLAVSGSAFKIADNEGPRPEDRIFMNVNYFSGVFHNLNAPGAPRERVTRIVGGFEKTCMDGDASIGIRVPIFQFNSEAFGGSAQLGDITIVTKAILTSNEATGSLVSGGVALTLPTGPNFTVTVTDVTTGLPAGSESINPTIIQPYLAFLYHPSEDVYIHGFSALAFPFDDSVPTVWFNDIGVGFWAYRNGRTAIVPTAEMHLTTPFSQHGSDAFPIGVIDTLDVTLAAHLIQANGGRFTLGAGFPLTGPKPFTWELTFQVNWAL